MKLHADLTHERAPWSAVREPEESKGVWRLDSTENGLRQRLRLRPHPKGSRHVDASKVLLLVAAAAVVATVAVAVAVVLTPRGRFEGAAGRRATTHRERRRLGYLAATVGAGYVGTFMDSSLIISIDQVTTLLAI